jgi:predicted AlkP superfamily pyrophosphatase or phosphodiesterase
MIVTVVRTRAFKADREEIMRRFRLAGLVMAVVCATITLVGASASRHVVLISIDGMRPASYLEAGPAKIPTLRALKASGAWASGVIGVLPTVTYPSHTTMITGVPPSIHGIENNTVLDPDGRSNGAWYWYARDIKVPTLPGLLRASGHTAAAVSWPVTVGMELDYNVPEHFRSRHPEALSLLRALSTPANLIDLYEAERMAPLPWPATDAERAGLAAYIIRTFRPTWTMLHIFDNDSASHEHGPDSPEALAALEASDGHVEAVLDALSEAGIRDRTDVVIVSDHGFLPLETQVQPNFTFKQAGLITVNDRGAITAWDAYLKTAGGAGFVYLSRPDDAALAAKVRGLLDGLAADPANGIDKIWTRADLDRIGAAAGASFAVTMQPKFYMGAAHTALRQPTAGKGGHGFDPALPALHASLILSGPRVTKPGDLGVVRMTQIAPTIAKWFGVRLVESADRPLW